MKRDPLCIIKIPPLIIINSKEHLEKEKAICTSFCKI